VVELPVRVSLRELWKEEVLVGVPGVGEEEEERGLFRCWRKLGGRRRVWIGWLIERNGIIWHDVYLHISSI